MERFCVFNPFRLESRMLRLPTTVAVEITERPELLVQEKLLTKYNKNKFPSGKELKTAIAVYFGNMMEEKQGCLYFTPEALCICSLVGFLTSTGASKESWKRWGESRRVMLTRAVAFVNLLFEQLAVQRLQTRGKASDLFIMKSQYKWREDETLNPTNERGDVSEKKLMTILERMAKKRRQGV